MSTLTEPRKDVTLFCELPFDFFTERERIAINPDNKFPVYLVDTDRMKSKKLADYYRKAMLQKDKIYTELMPLDKIKAGTSYVVTDIHSNLMLCELSETPGDANSLTLHYLNSDYDDDVLPVSDIMSIAVVWRISRPVGEGLDELDEL